MSDHSPCPHAAHVMLGATIQSWFPDPKMMSAAQAATTLTECKFLERHRGPHRSADGSMSWTGKLGPEELHYAEGLREVLRGDYSLRATPPVGARVLLVTGPPSSYLEWRRGVLKGETVGTVVEQSQLNTDDTGVLVDWGDGEPVRCDFSELGWAPGSDAFQARAS